MIIYQRKSTDNVDCSDCTRVATYYLEMSDEWKVPFCSVHITALATCAGFMVTLRDSGGVESCSVSPDTPRKANVVLIK